MAGRSSRATAQDVDATGTLCSAVDQVWIDNQELPNVPFGGFLYPQDDWCLTVTTRDGICTTLEHPSVGNSPATNIDQMAALIEQATGIPYVRGNIAGNDGDNTTPFANAAIAEICPGDDYVVSVEATVKGGKRDGFTISLAVGVKRGDVALWNVVADDKGGCTFVNLATKEERAELPECTFKGPHPGYEFPKPACPTTTFFPQCDAVENDPDSLDLYTIVNNQVITTIDCKGTIAYWLDDPDNDGLIEYEPEGDVLDCDTLEPPTPVFCKTDGAYTGKTKKFIVKGPLKRVSNLRPYIVGVLTPEVFDASATFGLPAGSVIVDSIASGHTNGVAPGAATGLVQVWKFGGTQEVCIKVVHGAVNGAGKTDGMTSLDGQTYTFQNPALDPAWSNNTAHPVYQVTHNGTGFGNSGGTAWVSDGPATAVDVFTDNSTNPNSSYRIFAQTYDCLEACEWVSDCGDVVKWFSGGIEVDPTAEECPDEPPLSIVDCLVEKATGDVIPDADYDGAFAWVTGRPNINAVWEFIDNRDPDNQVVIASGANFGEFITAMEALGYTEWSSGETHYFCPCPAEMATPANGNYFVTADGNTVSKPGCIKPLADVPAAPEKPEPETLKVLPTEGCLDAEILAKLCEIADLLECPDCPEAEAGNLYNVDTADVLSFPFTAQGEFINIAQALTVTDPKGCLAANPDAEITVKVSLDHSAGAYDGHRGFILTTSAGLFTAESASNTLGSGGIGTAARGVGYAPGEIGNQRNIRWLKITATASEWLAGVTLSYLAFGAVNNSFDTLHAQSFEICDGLEICDGC